MDSDQRGKAHRRLLEDIALNARQTESFTGRREISAPVMDAMARVPRHEFVLPGDASVAYVNRPQGIGFGQTISQPYIVAVMTDMLDLGPDDVVLEIGTGSGYQTAILAQLCRQVFSIETVKPLANRAVLSLNRLGYDNVAVRHGDGFLGWPEAGPFDAIIVTAAPEIMPTRLCDQLKPGGRIIVPIGPVHGNQMLKIGYKNESGKMHFTSTLPVAFVPMVPGQTR